LTGALNRPGITGDSIAWGMESGKQAGPAKGPGGKRHKRRALVWGLARGGFSVYDSPYKTDYFRGKGSMNHSQAKISSQSAPAGAWPRCAAFFYFYYYAPAARTVS